MLYRSLFGLSSEYISECFNLNNVKYNLSGIRTRLEFNLLFKFSKLKSFTRSQKQNSKVSKTCWKCCLCVVLTKMQVRSQIDDFLFVSINAFVEVAASVTNISCSCKLSLASMMQCKVSLHQFTRIPMLTAYHTKSYKNSCSILAKWRWLWTNPLKLSISFLLDG